MTYKNLVNLITWDSIDYQKLDESQREYDRLTSIAGLLYEAYSKMEFGEKGEEKVKNLAYEYYEKAGKIRREVKNHIGLAKIQTAIALHKDKGAAQN